MSTPTFPVDLVNQVVGAVVTRYRFDQMDAEIAKPALPEMQGAVLDALAEINSAPPQTTYALDQILAADFDPRWRTLLQLGTAKNILTTLVFDWTANGFTQNVGDFQVESKLSDFTSLRDSVKQEFDDRLTALKTASQKFVRGISPTNQSVIRPFGAIPLGKAYRFR